MIVATSILCTICLRHDISKCLLQEYRPRKGSNQTKHKQQYYKLNQLNNTSNIYILETKHYPHPQYHSDDDVHTTEII